MGDIQNESDASVTKNGGAGKPRDIGMKLRQGFDDRLMNTDDLVDDETHPFAAGWITTIFWCIPLGPVLKSSRSLKNGTKLSRSEIKLRFCERWSSSRVSSIHSSTAASGMT